MRQLKPTLVVVAAVFAAFSFSLSHAGGLYVGGGIGGAGIEDNSGTPSGTTFDESDSTRALWVGVVYES